MRFGTRELVFLLVLLAVPVGTYFSPWDTPVPGLKRLNAQMAEAQMDIERKRDKLRQLEAATLNLESLTAEIEKLTEAIEMFEQKLPVQREVEVILRDVWQLAAAHDLTPKRIRPDRPTTTADYGEMPIRMEIEGNFDGFYEFLLELEQLPRITRLPAMTLTKARNQEGNMEASVVLSIFFDGGEPERTTDQPQERRT